MIVDDESLVRIGLQSIIDWEKSGYRITGVFKNGEEALAAYAKQPFDVVLTDIRMPGMDGFELMREIRKIEPNAHIIVLSSYNDFEYTRQAIKLGVKDYISKYEMEPEELLRVLASLPPVEKPAGASMRVMPREIGAAGEDGNLAQEARRLLDHPQAPLKELPVRADGEEPGLEPDADAADMQLPLLRRRLGEYGGAFRWIALMPYPRQAGYSSAERKAMIHLADEMFSRLRNPVLLGESGGYIHGVYACDASGDGEGDDRADCARMAEEWTSAFLQKLNVSLAVGFASPSPLGGSWSDSRSYAESAVESSLFYGGVRFRELCGEQGAFSEEEWLALYKQIKQRIRYMQFGALADELSALIAEKGSRYKPTEWIRLGVAAASQLADFLIERYDPEPAELREQFGALWPFAESMGAARSAEEWRRTLSSVTARTHDAVARRQARGSWIERVKSHLEAHYGDPIKLEDMAQLANFSENHFSQRFRQETGQAFSDYLTDLRIREAVRLFRDTGLSTEEIAERVGYGNPNYFVKVFKRKTGQTITDFKGAR